MLVYNWQVAGKQPKQKDSYMRPSRWFLVLLAMTLLIGGLPAAAQAQGETNVVTVNGYEGLPENVLSPEEVDKVAALTSIPLPPIMLGPISPDDQAVLAIVQQEPYFLNVQDGSLAPLSPELLGGSIFPLGLIGGIAAWRDGQTFVTIGVDLSAGALESETPTVLLVTVDRTTGAVGAEPLALAPNELPAAISYDGSKLLLVSAQEAPTEEAMVRVPITWPTKDQQLAQQLSPVLQARAAELGARWPALLNAVQLFDDNDRSAFQMSEQPIDLRVLDIGSGARQELLTIPSAGIVPAGFTWSRDGTKIALTLIGVYGLEEEARPIFDGSLVSDQLYRDATGQLPPTENPFYQNNTVEAFDLLSGTRSTLRAPDAGPELLIGTSWSPDGKQLLVTALNPSQPEGRAYPTYIPQFSDSYSYRFYDASLQPSGRLDSPEFSAPFYSTGQFVGPDELIFTGLTGTDVHMYYYNRATGEFRNIADRAGSYGVSIFGALIATTGQGARQVVFNFSSFTSAPDLWRISWDGSGVTRLTWTNAELEAIAGTRQDPVSFTLSNGEVRTGTLIQPAGASFPPQDVPIIVWQEGGPGGGMNNQWLGIVESPYTLLPSFGFGLLVLPAAGRYGNGPDVYEQLYDNANFGVADIDEVAEAAQQMIDLGWTSNSKLGITGCSYGGYFTWQSIIRHPDLYAAANPQCALVDAVVEWSRGYQFLMAYIQGPVTPFDDPERYRADSPIYNLDSVEAAVLSFHGTADFLPITQNENAHLQINARGVPARMLKFVDAGHGLADIPEYEVYAAQEQIQWFRTYLR
jgi:dipeptidyl aminopeptidase/acylaminoacyl peptidase